MIDKKKDRPFVFVRCMTFNHEAYIKDALNGFVMQQTNFPFIVAIINDASTDKTKSVINEFVENNCIHNPEIDLRIEEYGTVLDVTVKDNPHCIFHIVHLNENHYGKKSKLPYFAKYENAAKYVAMCEGDDYWTDPLKLQKQVDFMEANPEYSITSHRYTIYNHEERVFTQDYLADLFEDKKNVFGVAFERKNYLDYPYMQTMTVMYKNDCLNYDYYTKLPIKGDLSLFYVSLLGGKGYCLNFDGAVYRRSNTGVYAKKTWDQKHFVGFNLYSKMYLYTQDIVFLPHALSHKDLVLSDIKNNILEGKTINKKCLRDVLCFLWKIGRMQEVIKRWLKIYYWKIKYMFKRINCYC